MSAFRGNLALVSKKHHAASARGQRCSIAHAGCRPDKFRGLFGLLARSCMTREIASAARKSKRARKESRPHRKKRGAPIHRGRLTSIRPSHRIVLPITGSTPAASTQKQQPSMFHALNIIYKEREQRSFIALTLRALAFTVAGIVLALLALAGIVAVPLGLKLLGIPDQSGIGGEQSRRLVRASSPPSLGSS